MPPCGGEERGEVRVHVDPSNQHAWKVFEVGKITSDNNIEVVMTGDAPLPPIPFPPPRTSTGRPLAACTTRW